MIKNWIGILLFALGLLSSCLSNDVFNPKAQLKKDIGIIQDFVAGYDHNAKATNGIWYTIDTVGLGIYPVLSDSVELGYSIRDIQYLNVELDTVFKTTSNPIPYKLLSTAIAGLQIGLPRFPVGSYGRLYVPSGLAFGTMGNTLSNVGSNINLLFRIKIVSVKGNRFSSDTAAITTYLKTISGSLHQNKRVVIKDPSGIRYWYDTLYSGAAQPDLTSHSFIDVSYKAKILSADTTYFADKQNATAVDLNDHADLRVITAWKIILPKITQGSTVTMYVPSGYGYGSVLNPSDTTITANSNLIYEVKLITVH